MSHKQDVLESLEAIRECIQETLRETEEIKAIAIEEEALIAIEKVNKTCSNALRYARQAEGLSDNPVNNTSSLGISLGTVG